MSEPESGPLPVQPEPDPVSRTRRNPAGAVGALLGLAATMLVVIGSFQPLVTARFETSTAIITSWEVRLDESGTPSPEGAEPGTPVSGVPLLIAAAIVLAGSVLGAFLAARPARRRLSLAHGLVALSGAGVLTGVVLTVAMQAQWWLDLLSPPSNTGAASAGIGAGLWTLVMAAGLAIVAAVVAGRPAKIVEDRVEPDTPRLGTPVVVHRLPDEPPPQEWEDRS